MSYLTLTQQSSTPSTPASGKVVLFATNSPKPKPKLVLPDGSVWNPQSNDGMLFNSNTSDSAAAGVDTYLAGSALTIPVGVNVQVGTQFKWRLHATKTASGIAAPHLYLRGGTAGTTADSALAQFDFTVSQSASVDTMHAEVNAEIKAIGSGMSALIEAGFFARHIGNSVGMWGNTLPIVDAPVSTGFDSTVANLIFGISVNPGASATWTFQIVEGIAWNVY